MKSDCKLTLVFFLGCSAIAHANYFDKNGITRIGQPHQDLTDELIRAAQVYDVRGWLVRPSTDAKPTGNEPLYKIESYENGQVHLLAANGERGVFNATTLDPKVIKNGIPRSQFKFFLSHIPKAEVVTDSEDYLVFVQRKEVPRVENVASGRYPRSFSGDVDHFGNVTLTEDTPTEQRTVYDIYETRTQATFQNGILIEMKEVGTTQVGTR